MKSKILHIIVGLGDGGAEHTLFKLVTNDYKYTHIIIALSSGGKYESRLKEKNLQVFSLGFKKNKVNLIPFFKLLKIIFLLKPKLIQSWMYHSDFITIFIKILFPSSIIYWGIRNSTYKFRDSKIRYLIAKFCSFFSYIIPKKIIACGETCKNDHIKFGYSKKNWSVIYNGLDINRFNIKNFNKDKIFKKLSIMVDKNKPILGMVARYDKQKGFDILLKSLGNLKKKGIDFSCLLVGHNITLKNKELNELILKNDLKNSILQLGQIDKIEVLYNFIDLLLLSSINGEGFPNVIIEAMGCGTPCLATNVGETNKIISKTGWIAKPNSINSFTILLEKAITEINSTKWQFRRIKCRERIVKNFGLKKMIEGYVKIWDQN